MKMEIEFKISKEDLYYALCELHGVEGFTFNTFIDFDSLTIDLVNRLEEDDINPKTTCMPGDSEIFIS